MLSTDAKVTHTEVRGVEARPDEAVLPIVLTVEAPTATDAVKAAHKLAKAIDRSLVGLDVHARPRRMAGERQKLLKKGVFGQGVRVHSRFELEVALALEDSWDFWHRLDKVEHVRASLHQIADGDARIAIGAPTYRISDPAAARIQAIMALRTALDEWQAATGLTLAELTQPEVVVRVEGPNRVWVEARAAATLRPTR